MTILKSYSDLEEALYWQSRFRSHYNSKGIKYQDYLYICDQEYLLHFKLDEKFKRKHTIHNSLA